MRALEKTVTIAFAIAILLQVPCVALAQDHRPRGWDKGTKAGWDGDCPPGWDKRTEAEKKKFCEDYEKARAELVLCIGNAKEPTLSVEVGCDLLLRSVNAGVDIGVALDLCKTSIELRLPKNDCEVALKATLAVHGTDVPQVEICAFVKGRLKVGDRGDVLVVRIKDDVGKRDKAIKEKKGKPEHADKGDKGGNGDKGGKGSRGGKGGGR
jgi:hypothetical protein